ncbi:capsule assembly Wzi family protein [Flavobacterium gawalongense]|uniref:Capsule assembly Wzi family protein n=1 Tax=Flavobacterium gawalongense TaxID=2594432 RepID=A0A553BX11_9FLAO|nr:capsule assembly Wzi family protein [Flavobacterium gawalongense]TRX04226.1 capsule assembly Wzi family protein [Flavobacterium gawalongense]TRX09324.1 capsule assembly Wzi family protein [Flavobacterium gawalongense]TRX12862.1 capsule assembly Wzi family protein [Flavobacterium gawalongense]TRX13207.1 capsule assembly Wzi family protein [Flavobacterium gawalongense]TRX30731.1 capsule assembly Wzi family protein [Flavobacterium gawalongense]
MKKGLSTLLLSFYSFFIYSQGINNSTVQSGMSAERFPVFLNCENLQSKELENCFYYQVQNFVFQNFEVPENLKQNNFKGSVEVLFEVDSNGVFKVIYVNAIDEDLLKETKRVFGVFPKIKPATYNGKPTYSKYTNAIAIPLKSPEQLASEALARAEILPNETKQLTELDSMVYKKFNNPQFESHLNIPFSHSYYAQFDASLNQVGSNNHTASKPYTYVEVSKYYDLKAVNDKLKKHVSGWWTRKLWNENTVEIQGDGYWFTLNPILDLQVGKASQTEANYTYINTRAINFRGGLGKQLNFTTTVFESQGRFADYFNRYAESIKPAGGNPAIILGMGIAKDFKTDAYDFPLAEANITFAPSKYVDLQLGYGRNFIGDGYRSLLESDGASSYPYFKLNTNFWKIKYTNTYMWLKDVRPEVTLERTYATKFMANHYLSWNVSNKLNLGFFESVIWTNTNDRGFDVSFVNPIIFYRSVEFASSARTGNAVLGLTYKYKWNNQINLYGQFILDEFSLGDIKERDNSWKNKYGYQLGVKYYNAFKVDNLVLQLEYNHVRPYVYSHSVPITNYGHNNQSIGHQWGGNFKEFIAIARYHKDRYFADAKITVGTRGLDFDTTEDSFNYGGNIYKDYDEKRALNSGVKVGQGNKTAVFITDIQAGYLINPATNLKFFGSYIYRSFDPTKNTATTFNESTNWFTLGIRSDVFNWYFDY